MDSARFLSALVAFGKNYIGRSDLPYVSGARGQKLPGCGSVRHDVLKSYGRAPTVRPLGVPGRHREIPLSSTVPRPRVTCQTALCRGTAFRGMTGPLTHLPAGHPRPHTQKHDT
ncbi:hypothetical protein GCM10023220_27780 [Streptomyces ziwulingensis]|uniref:Uncharacterized protein n=1 Tax=Streptomyces ziwulingensis TaxID=1045501 RepID=A0ABP9BP15_9ACTN